MVSLEELRELSDFIYKEARLADEGLYEAWEALWADDGTYWVPRAHGKDDPTKHLSHIFDNRRRITTRVKMLASGYRYSQSPASPMRRLLSNIEAEKREEGLYWTGANFSLHELAIQATDEINVWVGRVEHTIRRTPEGLRLVQKKVILINGDEPIPNLTFLI